MEFEYNGICFCTIVQNVYLLYFCIRDNHEMYSLVISAIQSLIFSKIYKAHRFCIFLSTPRRQLAFTLVSRQTNPTISKTEFKDHELYTGIPVIHF